MVAAILAAGLFVVGQVIFKILHPSVPVFEAMGLIGALALAANGTCLVLLWKHRNDDVNISSVWECSRNDIAANIAVLLAAALVWITSSGWPDVLIGGLLALLFLRSAVRVFRNAITAIKTGKQIPPAPKVRIPIRIVKGPR